MEGLLKGGFGVSHGHLCLSLNTDISLTQLCAALALPGNHSLLKDGIREPGSKTHI